jgi:phosphoribosyl-dephospho-CoA transferase
MRASKIPYSKDPETGDWASPQELDSVLARNARLEARLSSHTSPLVWLTLGALGGVLYYVARKNIADDRITQAIENAFI